MPLHWKEKPHAQAQITVSSEQNCSASPICSEVKVSLSERVNERLKWILANSAHLPRSNINHWSFQGRWVIKWSFSRDRKGVKGTAVLQLPLAGISPPDPILRSTLGCVTAPCGLTHEVTVLPCPQVDTQLKQHKTSWHIPAHLALTHKLPVSEKFFNVAHEQVSTRELTSTYIKKKTKQNKQTKKKQSTPTHPKSLISNM